MAKFQKLKGFRDFYPEDFAKRAYITDTWRRVARQHGFQEYDGPPLESLELYRHKSGDELVGQLYSFVDKGGRDVALRPEMTPTVARMVAERWQSLPKPVRWFSIPQLFRYERPQAGRLREHYQLNVDIFGEPSGMAEAEVLAFLIRAFEAFGLTSDDVQVRLSDRRVLNHILERIGVTVEQLPVVYSVLDKIGREEPAAASDRLRAAGVAASVEIALFEMVTRFKDARTVDDLRTLVGSDAPFSGMYAYLNGMVENARAWITFDLTIVRGLGYYTGTVFEAFDTQQQHRAICGGGRYDGLLESLGGNAAAAVGLGWGDVVLAELLESKGKMPVPAPSLDWLVYPGTGAGIETALPFVRSLRKMGFAAMCVSPSEGANARAKAAGPYRARFHYVVAEGRSVWRMDTRAECVLDASGSFLDQLQHAVATSLDARSTDAIWALARSMSPRHNET
jgi:histidyl-tRNA synthetase